MSITIWEYLPRSLIGYWYTVDLWICMFDDACHSWTEMLLCHSFKISISLERLYQSSPFFHHCKGKSITYLEMDIICSIFFLSLKYDSHPMIAFFFFTHPVYVYFLWNYSWRFMMCIYEFVINPTRKILGKIIVVFWSKWNYLIKSVGGVRVLNILST